MGSGGSRSRVSRRTTGSGQTSECCDAGGDAAGAIPAGVKSDLPFAAIELYFGVGKALVGHDAEQGGGLEGGVEADPLPRLQAARAPPWSPENGSPPARRIGRTSTSM